MSDWQPSSGVETARRRAAMFRRARRYFESEGVLEVDTPSLSNTAGSDPNVEMLSVLTGAGDEYFLHTSPEFCMKRLLAAGYPDIYSICRVFRDAEAGSLHLAEFTLIEWYRLGFDITDIAVDTARLIASCLDDLSLVDSRDTYDYCAVFEQFAGVDVFTASIDDLAACAGADNDLRSAMGNDRDSWLDLILATVVAPEFASDRLTILQHFPASMAALAQLCPADPRLADRFEVFMGERELANGYVELTDADEQRRRFEHEAKVRRQSGRRSGPFDEKLLAALDAGLPQCAGVAVGAERLQMVLDKADTIGDVVTFTTGVRHE